MLYPNTFPLENKNLFFPPLSLLTALPSVVSLGYHNAEFLAVEL